MAPDGLLCADVPLRNYSLICVGFIGAIGDGLLSWRQTIDKVGQLLVRGLVSKDNRPMKCTTSKVLTCRVTNSGPIWSTFYVFFAVRK